LDHVPVGFRERMERHSQTIKPSSSPDRWAFVTDRPTIALTDWQRCTHPSLTGSVADQLFTIRCDPYSDEKPRRWLQVAGTVRNGHLYGGRDGERTHTIDDHLLCGTDGRRNS
jgi:hypothetical protein